MKTSIWPVTLSVYGCVEMISIFQPPVSLPTWRRILHRFPTVLMVPSLPLASLYVWLTPVNRRHAFVSREDASRSRPRKGNPDECRAWDVTCGVGQRESDGISRDVDGDVLQRSIQREGERLLLPRVPRSLKNCHLRRRAWWFICLFFNAHWRPRAPECSVVPELK